MNHYKPTISEFYEKIDKKNRNKILFYSILIFSPICILITLYTEFKTNSSSLKTISQQVKQGLILGDEISVTRANHTILTFPNVSFSKVNLQNGTCLSVFRQNENSLNLKIEDLCKDQYDKYFYKISEDITNSQNEKIAFITVGYYFPWMYLLALPFIITLVSLLIFYITKTSTSIGIQNMKSIISELPNLINRNHDQTFEIQELETAYLELKRLQNIEFDHIKSASLNKLSSQVSHDIRSPLAALEMISGSLNELPEDKRLIIRNSINRIRDIANDLLDENKRSTSNTDVISNQALSSKKETLSIQLLSPIIDSITTEKRIQYRNQINTRIEFNQSKNSYGLFSEIQPNEFKRVLSNIINNAVESLPNNSGIVDISIKSLADLIEISIADTGKGIPQDVISKLGNRGVTYGKESGSGLGLSHAKEMIEHMSGSIKIESTENVGTVITITLPRKTAPDWFVPEIHIKKDQALVVFDDDQSVHQIWKGRLESTSHTPISMFNFSSPHELRKYYSKNFADLENALFLMDYEISGNPETGLDIIETLGIAKQAILVTSRYEEKEIRDRCERLGVKLIPKSMSGFVPVVVS